MKIYLVYDAAEENFVQENLLPMLEEHEVSAVPMYGAATPELPAGGAVYLYVSDAQAKALLPALFVGERVAAFLPHPAAVDVCAMTGVESRLAKAVEHFLRRDSSSEASYIDLLYCNDAPVFNMLALGSTFLMTAQTVRPKGIKAWVKRYIGSFFRLRPFQIEIERKNGSVERTAVAGLIAVTHQSNAVVNRFVPGSSYLNDGMFHTLMVSPRSLLELFSYAFRVLWQPNQLPSFAAHIKSETLLIKSVNGPFSALLDREVQEMEELHLRVEKGSFGILPGKRFRSEESEGKNSEVYKVRALPQGEAAMELASRPLPLIKRASTEEFKELFQVLRENASLRGSYLVLMVLSTMLAVFGLFANSSPVVIGAMILAPLMAPIISMSMATLRQDKRMILDSLRTILAGMGLAFGFAVLLTWLTPIELPGEEILARTRPNLLDLGVAVVSGVAGAYAHAREEIAKTLAGVAIAVALVPPLAVAGIGLGWMEWNIFSGAVLLLGTNLAGMILAGALTFLVLGFSPFKLATRGLLISLLAVAVLSIPLVLSFQRMVYEHEVTELLNNWETDEVTLKDARVLGTDPLVVSLRMVSSTNLDDASLEKVKKHVEERLGCEVRLEISVSLER